MEKENKEGHCKRRIPKFRNLTALLFCFKNINKADFLKGSLQSTFCQKMLIE